jgi:hypothetical protein
MNTENRLLQFAHRAPSLRGLRSLQHSWRRLPRESLRTRPTPRSYPPRHPFHLPNFPSRHLQRPPRRALLRRHPRRGPAHHRSEMRGPPRPRPHRPMPQLLTSLRPPRRLSRSHSSEPSSQPSETSKSFPFFPIPRRISDSSPPPCYCWCVGTHARHHHNPSSPPPRASRPRRGSPHKYPQVQRFLSFPQFPGPQRQLLT